MRIDTEAFLTITALLAAAMPACSSDSGGAGIDGGSAAASAEAAAGGGMGGTGGGTSGSSGQANGRVDAGGAPVPEGGVGACLGDAVRPLPDGGAGDAGTPGAPDFCATLPGAVDGCRPDSGVESLAPAYAICSDLEYAGRPGVFATVARCLASASAPADPCGAEAHAHALACYDGAVVRACPRPAVDGGLVDPCNAFVAACKTVTSAQCDGALRVLSEAGAAEFSVCLGLATPVGDDGEACRTAFWSCALPGVSR